LLDGTLPPTEEQSLHAHLELCIRCQATLQGLAAGNDSWQNLALLARKEPPADAALREVMAAMGDPRLSAVTATEPRPGAAVALSFLDPSDDPRNLGRLGPYEVRELIGRGGMGLVLQGRDTKLDRLVAIKVMAPELAAQATAHSRFLREARAAAAVNHENVVAIYAVEESRGLPYIVMQYVPGGSLEERLAREGPLPLPELLRVGVQVAAGLAAAHARGLIHRDIKPANILWETPRVRITDFGLARAVDDLSISGSGLVAGTPEYMAPEQARGEFVDHRADLFSLGTLLYVLGTGMSPFRAGNPLAVLRRVCDEVPTPANEANPSLPRWLAASIARLHAKNPAQRFQSAAEVGDLLERHLLQLQSAKLAAASLLAMPTVLVEPLSTASDSAVPRRSWSWKWYAAVASLLFGLAVVGLLMGYTLLRNRGGEKGAEDREVASSSDVVFKPHLPVAESEVVTLPGAVADVAVGGGGRYLVFHLERSLAVFDVQEGKVVRQLPLAEEHAHFAAGATRLVVLYPGARLLQTWDLTRFAKERSAPFPGSMATGEIRQVCMGSASNGPLFVYLANEKRTLALNPATLETTEVHWRHWGPTNAYGPLHLRAAPDGDTLVGWSGGWAGAEMAFFRQGVQHGSDDNIEFSMGLFALPSADGRRLFTPWAIVNRDGGAIKPPELANTYRVPAHEPGFFLALHSQGRYPDAPREKEPTARLPAVSQVVVCTDDGRRLFPLDGIDGLNAGTGLFWERRVHYYPRAGLLAVLIAPDRLLLRRVDLVKNLDKTGADYIVVVSQPPLAHPGSTWSYQLDVRAKAAVGKVTLEAGPEGLAVTPEGRMTWRVPDDYPNPAATVKLTLRDARGQEMLQQFSVIVDRVKHQVSDEHRGSQRSNGEGRPG
jgi:serine/threonine-protein kinase